MTTSFTRYFPTFVSGLNRLISLRIPGYVYGLSLKIFIFIFIIGFAVPFEGNAKKLLFKPNQKTIVLDPGHGGKDNGARGPNGSLEKSVTLTLARLIASELKKMDYRVILTRTDDYQLEVLDRTAVANHEKADIFVSLHTGGSFLRQTSGLSVFYFKDTPEYLPPPDIQSSKQPEANDTLIEWDTIQKRHIATSLELAQHMHKYLIHPSTHNEGDVQGAHLLVLKGADMPAILIETGYITNPVEENTLNDQDMITDIAKKVSNAIIIFMNQSE